MIRYAGAFDGLPNWPPDHANQGWSNFTTGVNTLCTRYADGDFFASMIWREAYGNVNHLVAQSRRQIWQDTFAGTGVNDIDPTYAHTVADFTVENAVYALTVPIELTPNPRRGTADPPRLTCRIRARKTGGGGGANANVRLYSVPHLAAVLSLWEGVGGSSTTGAFVNWRLNASTYPGTPGWVTDSVSGLAELELTPTVTRVVRRHPAVAAGESDIDVEVSETVLVLAGAGDGANGVYIEAVEVWEEVVAV